MGGRRGIMPALYTVGHSTRTIENFIEVLAAHGIERVVDIRTIPRSRMNPQFNSEALERSLKEAGIEYEHWKGLGGLRRPKRDSINKGWHNESFRGFADYMQTEEFEKNLEDLIKEGQEKKTAIMCAEGVPFRCHRSLIADALTARGVQVLHITGKSAARPHEMTSFAKVKKGRVTYPEE
jgi:uncharacterized protein (DUF488 family)